MMFLIKYWRASLTAILISFLTGYLWYSHAKYLNLQLTQKEEELQASQKHVETLEEEKQAFVLANKENAQKRAEIGLELIKTQKKIGDLLNEEPHECLDEPFSDNLVDRL